MANTYTQLYAHIVFSTKNRFPWIKPEFEQRLWEYLGGISRQNDAHALLVGGIDDHVHIVASISPKLAVSKLLQLLKGGSSHWANETIRQLKGFGWQDGYSAFSVSPSNLAAVLKYVKNQREHHRTITFQDEYRELLKKHGVEFDERYLFG